MEFVIKAENISKEFKGKVILKNINMTIEKGQIYGLLGANGAGKTTLMKMMLNLLKPTTGNLTILGSETQGTDMRYLAKVGSLIETPVFYPNMTVKQNLEIHCEYIGEKYKAAISETLELVGLKEIEDYQIKELSLGMKQRLAIGRALLCQPELLILDEPINGIDPEGIADIRNLLLTINQQLHVTMIISSHIINEIEKIADTVGIISEGELLEELDKTEFQQTSFDLEAHFIEILHKRKVS
ncbi:ABC-2 type transport system ATP-binding protein [Enterococcus sp. AZ194]|uniref:ABC transporter ATP-binding protein n=1 Tax=Enterococcus sp. AZ194 TaxID=2774629 RepID=UPI003F233660